MNRKYYDDWEGFIQRLRDTVSVNKKVQYVCIDISELRDSINLIPKENERYGPSPDSAGDFQGLSHVYTPEQPTQKMYRDFKKRKFACGRT